ncbi:MAG: hypothetical protein AVDCRST_MAG30-2931 [uncultured Solirubrobacteraceae bacterium]|uniref:HTH luxR-type domain-containing protein n=1 Tax=uncultured Solirubrobacteraceae bacterium TaxID=1162706 RepID=A0A6J4TBH6_9ACTN|nr:MAG: hypothetical protein AVDCRST_MAG30-2931 [uncultured Solirubrobacteraceae bacterium]
MARRRSGRSLQLPSAMDGDHAFWMVFERSRNPMLLFGDDRVYTHANEAACAALGLPRERIVGQRMGYLTPPDQKDLERELWDRLMRTGHLVSPWRVTLADGRTVELLLNTTLHAAPGGLHLSVHLLDGDEVAPAPGGAARGALSPRERQVVQMLAFGRTGEQVAQELSLSPETVRTHVRNAMEHAGARTRAQLVAIALRDGLIDSSRRA